MNTYTQKNEVGGCLILIFFCKIPKPIELPVCYESFILFYETNCWRFITEDTKQRTFSLPKLCDALMCCLFGVCARWGDVMLWITEMNSLLWSGYQLLLLQL